MCDIMDIRDLEYLADYNGIGDKQREEEYTCKYKASEVRVKKLSKEEIEELYGNKND